MRALLHTLAVIVLLPYLALAMSFVLFDYATSRGSLPGFLDALLAMAASLLSWGGILAIGGALLVMVLGTSGRYRWATAAALCAAAAVAVAVVVIGSSSAIGAGELFFLLPCLAALACLGWIAAREWPTS